MSAPELWVDIADLFEVQDLDEIDLSCGLEEAHALGDEGMSVVSIEGLLDDISDR